MMLEIISQTQELNLVPETYEPLIVSRRCSRCEDELLVKVAENEGEDDALDGELCKQEWQVIGGKLFCGGCVRSREDDELYG